MNTRYLISLWATLLLLLAVATSVQAQKIFYVITTGGTAPTSASTTQASPSWASSTTDLQGAINAATTGGAASPTITLNDYQTGVSYQLQRDEPMRALL